MERDAGNSLIWKHVSRGVMIAALAGILDDCHFSVGRYSREELGGDERAAENHEAHPIVVEVNWCCTIQASFDYHVTAERQGFSFLKAETREKYLIYDRISS